MFNKILDYIKERINEFSTWIAVILLIISVLFLPNGLVAFIIVALSLVIILLPDSKFTKVINKYFR